MANGAYKYLAYESNPPETATVKDLKFDRASFEATTKLHGLYDATDADLGPFAAHGGKLILFHGLADPQISPIGTISYYTQMQKIMGKTAADKFARFYLLPGVGHCDGGGGPDQMDLLGALMSWVETSQAPYALMAAHLPPGSGPRGGGGYDWMKVPQVQTATPDRTRPVYPYPLTAKYVGTGSTDDAKNFVAGPPSVVPENLGGKWLGSSFYAAHQELWCTGSGAAMSCKKTPYN
jgi:feruloyl esterase